MPIISPSPWTDGATYTVSGATFAAADIRLSEIDESAATMIVTVPAGATVAALRDPANWTGPGTEILSAGVWSGAALGNWQVAVVPGAAPTDPATVQVTSAASSGGWLRLLFTNLSGPLMLEPGAGTSIDRVLTEPTITNAQVTSVLPVKERTNVAIGATVTATAVANPAPAAPLPLAPDVVSLWTENPANPAAVGNFTPGGTSATFKAPAIYAELDLDFTLVAGLDVDGSGTIAATEPQSSAVLNVTVTVQRYALALVLDRSGSMASGGRWTAAVRAAAAWRDLFAAFRPGDTHRVGVMTFEDAGCGWRATASTESIFRDPEDASGGPADGLEPLAAIGDVSTWNLGGPGSCTPIGDALVVAWQKIGLALNDGTGGVGAVVLLTDGYENSGRVTIASAKGTAGASFANERVSPSLSAANGYIGANVYTLAIGTSVDADRLNDLGSAYYHQITDAADVSLRDALAGMLGHLLDAESVSAAPPLQPDNPPPTAPLYFHVDSGDAMVAFLVSVPGPGGTTATDRLRVGWRAQDSAGAFINVDPANAAVMVENRSTHQIMRVDLRTFLGAAEPASGTEWRLERLSGGGQPLPLPATGALVVRDLRTKADVAFDKRQYFIGEPIRLLCRIRAGGAPVTGATVGIDAARPGEGLGTFLTTNAPRYKPRPPDRRQPDADVGKGLMFKTLLADLEMADLPLVTPPEFLLFDDGAHGDGAADDGDYSNAFTDTAKEGTYTFRFRIEATLPNGSRYRTTLVRSTWVGVRPDPALPGLFWTTLGRTEEGLVRSAATFTPKSTGGEFLGPFRRAEITAQAHGGTLKPLTDNLDGSYTLVVVHPPGTDPILAIEIYGFPMRPTGPHLDGGGTSCWTLYVRAFCCTWRRIRKFLFGS